MITYSNIKALPNVPFESYLKLEGFSHSFLKREVNGVAPYMEISDKMKLGSLIDGLLMQPDQVDIRDAQYQIAVKMAIEIKNTFGGLIKDFVSQMSYTGIAEHQGFKMPVCGRLDWLLPNHAVIDLKCTGAKSDNEFTAFITHMGYNNQMFNYCGLSQTQTAYIIPYSTTSKKCLSVVKIPIDTSNNFWAEKILKYGTV
jgi:hypothetical protein